MEKRFRKSWVAYSNQSLGFIFGLIFLIAPIYYSDWVEINFIKSTTNSVRFLDENEWIVWIALLLPGIILTTSTIYKIFLLRTYVLIVTDEYVRYKGGILPWKRTERFWYYSQIFQSQLIQNPQFLSWFLRFGTIIIVEKQGTTEKDPIHLLHRAGIAVRIINQQLKIPNN